MNLIKLFNFIAFFIFLSLQNTASAQAKHKPVKVKIVPKARLQAPTFARSVFSRAVDHCLAKDRVDQLACLQIISTPQSEQNTALRLLIAQQLQQNGQDEQAYQSLRKLRAPKALNFALAQTRLLLARRTGRSQLVMSSLIKGRDNRPKRKRYALDLDILDQLLSTSNSKMIEQGIDFFTQIQRPEMMAMSELHQLVVSHKKNEKRKLRVQAKVLMRHLKSPALVQRLDAYLRKHKLRKSLLDSSARSTRLRYCASLNKASLAPVCLQMLKKISPGLDRDRLRLDSLVSLRRNQEAIKLVNKLSQANKKDRQDLLLLRAQLLARLGRGDEAVQAYQNYARQHKGKAQGDEAAFFAAWIYHEGGQSSRAAQHFSQFIKQRPKARRTSSARWFLALNLYRAGQDDAALQALEQYLAKPGRSGSWVAAKLLYADLISRKGRRDEAINTLQKLASGVLQPLEYAPYYRAVIQAELQRLRQKQAFTATPDLCPVQVATRGAGVGEISAMHRAHDGPKIARDVEDCRTKLRRYWPVLRPKTSAAMTRGLDALAATGLCAAARWTLKQIAIPTQEPTRRAYLQTLLAAGDATRSLRLATRYYANVLSRPTQNKDRWIWQLAYPDPGYFAYTAPKPENAVPQNLVLAVSRQESHFIPDVRSPVGALGLMQIMPATGARLGALSGLDVQPKDLLVPQRNVQLGRRYLELLNESLSGNWPWIVASYNAGPRNVQGWAERFGDQPLPVFVESIPFRETRGYVKKVLAAATVYAWLQGRDDANAWAKQRCFSQKPRYLIEF